MYVFCMRYALLMLARFCKSTGHSDGQKGRELQEVKSRMKVSYTVPISTPVQSKTDQKKMIREKESVCSPLVLWVCQNLKH